MPRSRPARSRTARSSRRRDALERMSYRRSDAVTVLSDDLADNVRGKLPPSAGERVHVIPNFVDTDAIVPGDRLTPVSRRVGLGDGPIVLYAGNVGFSQSLDLMLAAAREIARCDVPRQRRRRGATPTLERAARGSRQRPLRRLSSSRHRLSELLATGDIHVVALEARPGPGQRAVEDVLDHGRRPSRPRVDRSGHRRAEDPGPSRAAAWRWRPDEPVAFVAGRCASCSPTRPPPRPWGDEVAPGWSARRHRRPSGPHTTSSSTRCAR